MVKIINQPRCSDCGEPAILTIPKAGNVKHFCFDCLGKPPNRKEVDTMTLIKLGLIVK